MRTSTTTSGSKQHKHLNIKPLSSDFFDNLIKLETDIVQKRYTAESLDELMNCYGQAVEYYDSIKDQISSYFIFKIQDILMTKKAMKVLMAETAKAHAAAVSITLNAVSIDLGDVKDSRELDPNDTNPGNTSQIIDQQPSSPNKSKVTFASGSNVIVENAQDESSDEEEDEEEKEAMVVEKQRRVTGHHKRAASVKSLAEMKNQKQKMFSLQLKLQNAKVQDKQNLHDVLSSFGNFSEYNDGVVLHDLEVQKLKIRNKLAKKRKDGFMNFTHSSNGFAQLNLTENMTIESVLKGLDDEDSAQSQEQEPGGFNHGNESGLEVIETEMKKQTAVMCNE